jgi:hypothetical protein
LVIFYKSMNINKHKKASLKWEALFLSAYLLI